jgi:hypothetical protein
MGGSDWRRSGFLLQNWWRRSIMAIASHAEEVLLDLRP